VLVLNERDPLHPRAGGAEVHVAEIAKGLAARGWRVTQLACSFPGAAPAQELPGLAVRRLGPLPLYYPRAVATTARETRRGHFDVVVEHLNKLPFCARAYARAPVLAVNHHLFGASAFLQVPWPLALGVVALERLIPLVYRDVPFLAVSESSRQDLVRRGIPAQRIGILHNGIQLPACEPRPVGERPLRLAYLGRLEPYKRVELLLRALARLAPRFPQLDLVIVGRGSERAALERRAAALGVAARVRFTGFVSDAERDACLAQARVCVCPSVKEGWGITVIEANALGLPVVATDAPGLRDAVRDGETGVLVPDAAPEAFAAGLAQALEGLLGDPERLARLSAAARAWARRFDWDHSAQRMAEALEALLGEAAAGRRGAGRAAGPAPRAVG
jgi:glycosyltransferase involved in cell wall biosynthesis